MLIVIPAAGFGTRMNLSPTSSKEMLPDPYNDNKPVIQWILDLVKDYSKIVITREEKEDLIDYLYTDPEDDIYVSLIPDTTKEVANTILYSKPHWQEKNILLLPDTRFAPTDIVSKIDEELETHDFVFAVHEVEDIKNWGWVDIVGNTVMAIQEKPNFYHWKTGYNPKKFAWGIIGFRNIDDTEKFFQAYLDRTYFNLTSYKCCVINLTSFKDITRTGKIESY